MRRFLALAARVLVACVVCVSAFAADVPLLHVSAGRQPNDTGSEGGTKFALVDSEELGGKALRIAVADGDSFGNKGAEPSDWKAATSIRFEMFNPSPRPIALHFNVKHGRSKSYETRVDYEFTLKPGRQGFRFPLAELANVNGSPPDWGSVQHWYFAVEEGSAPTLYLSDVVLEAGGPPPAVIAAPIAGGGGGEEPAFRITGTIGGQTVDLLVTPLRGAKGIGLPLGPPPGPPGPPGPPPFRGSATQKIAIDPARIARLKAAKAPPVTTVLEFNTPQADAVLSALEVFPPDNP